MIDEGTSLSDAVAPEISFHWVTTTTCIKELVVIPQGSNLWAFVALVKGRNIGYIKYAEGICAESGYYFIAELPEAKLKLKGGEGASMSDKK